MPTTRAGRTTRHGRVVRAEVRVRSAQPERLVALLRRQAFAVQRLGPDELRVEDSSAGELADLAHFFRVAVHLLVEGDGLQEAASLLGAPEGDAGRGRPHWTVEPGAGHGEV